MHPYTSDDAKPKTLAYIAVAAVAVAYLATWLMSLTPVPGWWVSAPSLAGSYAILYNWFESSLWKADMARRLKLSTVADVAGRYRGHLISAYPENSTTEVPIEINITQSWQRIHVALEVNATKTSRSASYMAAVAPEGTQTRLSYSYRSQVMPGVADLDMADHEGTADLLISVDGTATGRYFNGRPRCGTILVTRE